MKITFFGAAQTVTGSCYVIETAGTRFAVDCGMHQGNPAIEKQNFETKYYRPTEIDFILLTHAHIDHSGLLPRMTMQGFTGPIYCTEPTQDLVALMLEDSAHIQKMEQEWKLSTVKRRGAKSKIEILYDIEDAKQAASQTKAVELDTFFEPYPGIQVKYHYAGHILGAAFLELHITENGNTTKLLFSGDLGRPGALLLHEPKKAIVADWIFLESTYGDRDHKGEDDTLKELAAAVEYSYARREKVIIPTFAVERTQEVLYSLILLRHKNMLPADLPIYVDSPLATRATDVFLKYASQLHTPEIGDISAIKNPIHNIRYTLSTQESQELNAMKGPAIILSASGMANAGRIKHHLKHNIWRPGASIVFVGYQSVGTLGRKIVDGASSIRLFNEELIVKAKVFTINGFSAHAGQTQLLEWLSPAVRPGLNVVLVHGELQKQEVLAGVIREKWKIGAQIPSPGMEITLEGGISAVHEADISTFHPRVDWNFLLEDIDTRMSQLHARMTNISDRPWEEQMDVRERLIEINRDLLDFLTHL